MRSATNLAKGPQEWPINGLLVCGLEALLIWPAVFQISWRARGTAFTAGARRNRAAVAAGIEVIVGGLLGNLKNKEVGGLLGPK